MSLANGSRLGPYDVLGALGAGGMGEVYRARDPRLGRELALKVLPAPLSRDQERLARFEREARAASALSHPNIVTIYEVAAVEGVTYIAMELVLGRTLRELLAEGALPLKRLSALAAQIADGLAAAHQAGIVHRDLKPDNLMITREGHVKILDFGLAKLTLAAPEVSQAATVVDGTSPGLVLGTVGYMSPEQAAGKAVDFRADQFALGAMLYEMAAGTRPFARPTAAETLAAVIREEPPPLRTLAPQTPLPLQWVIDRCLAKDPDERYGSTRDLARDLVNLRDHLSDGSAGSPAPSLAQTPRRWRMAVPAGVALLLALAAATAGWLRARPVAEAPPVRFAVAVPRGATYAPLETSRGVAISPDGTRLSIEAYAKGRRQLFLRRLDADESVPIEGTADATGHFWSPDSRFIAFYANGKLKRVPAEGGTAQDLCAATFGTVGSWNRDGTILFAQLNPAGIFQVSDQGGEPTRVTSPEPSRRGLSHWWPHFLPDGRRFLYLALEWTENGDRIRNLYLGSLDGAASALVAQLDSRVEFVAPDRLLFVREGTLFAQPFDAVAARLTGGPAVVTPAVNFFYGPANASFSASQTGVMAYQAAPAASRLLWLDRIGRAAGALGPPSVLDGFRISPDGRSVAVSRVEPTTGTGDIWMFDLSLGVSDRIHDDAVDEVHPVWWPDGSKLLFRSDGQGPPDIHEMSMGVPGSDRLLFRDEMVQQAEDVSPDARLLVYLNDPHATADILLLPLDGDHKPTPWLQTRFDERSPRFSPDGQWIAYQSDESGDAEIYMARTQGVRDKKRISPAGGSSPRWRRDGRELYYLAPGGAMMMVPVTPGLGTLAVGAPQTLFSAATEIFDYDVTPDGQRFLASVPVDAERESPIRVILNWQRGQGPAR